MNVCRAEENGEWFHVYSDDLSPVYEDRYAFVGPIKMADGQLRARVEIETEGDAPNEWCHIGFDGKPISDARYKFVGDFHCGFARVQRFDGKWLHIFSNGEPAYGDIVFDAAHDFEDDCAKVLDGNKWVIVQAFSVETVDIAIAV
ncbi:MAG: WG repeat-containing protein [Patescibacteria group bacterium]